MIPAPPCVSVVIPTRGRPELVQRAVRSALAQSLRDLEVVVVIDGPDFATRAALAGITDARLRVIALDAPRGAAGARNAGAAAARGSYIALLDDDDVWLPAKLQRQLAAMGTETNAIVSCLSRLVGPQGESVWPQTAYCNDRPFGEYLFGRPGLFAGDSYIQSSSLLLPRPLYQRAPFPLGSAHDDWEFVLRLCAEHNTALLTLREVLVEVSVDAPRPSLTRGTAWRASLAWAQANRALLTPRGYSGFLLCVVAPRADAAGAHAALPGLLWHACRHGAPRATQLAAFAGFCALPQPLRRRLRGFLPARHKVPLRIDGYQEALRPRC